MGSRRRPIDRPASYRNLDWDCAVALPRYNPIIVTNALASLSHAIVAIAAAAAPYLLAVRIGPHVHLTGVAWADGLVVTRDRELPASEGYTILLPGGVQFTGRLVQREPALGLALLQTTQPNAVPPLFPALEPALGSLALVLGSDAQGEATMRLTAIRQQRGAQARGAILDLAAAQAEPGALVLDPLGAVLGLLDIGADGTVSIVPHSLIEQFVESATRVGNPAPPNGARSPVAPRQGNRRAWFGIALQPITLPEPLVARAGQAAGRLIVGITTGGPADEAGLRVGDVLLSLDRHPTSGTHSLRTFLESVAIGSKIEARVLRDDSIATAWLTVAEHP